MSTTRGSFLFLTQSLKPVYLIGKVRYMETKKEKKCFKCKGKLKESGMMFAGGEKEYVCTQCGTSQP